MKDSPTKDRSSRNIVDSLTHEWIDRAVAVSLVAEFVIAVTLLVALLLGVAYFVQALVFAVGGHVLLSPSEIKHLLDVALVLFIAIELFRIAVAYLRHEDVMCIVLEAAFVAVARKIVLFEVSKGGLVQASALALLLLAIAATYLAVWVGRRARGADDATKKGAS